MNYGIWYLNRLSTHFTWLCKSLCLCLHNLWHETMLMACSLTQLPRRRLTNSLSGQTRWWDQGCGMPPVGMFSKITWGQSLGMAACLWEQWSCGVVGRGGVPPDCAVMSSESNQGPPRVQNTWSIHIQPCRDIEFWTVRCWNCAAIFLFPFIGYSDVPGDTHTKEWLQTKWGRLACFCTA